MIATLATRADEAGHQDVRRLDRPRRVPALSPRTSALMMTPRGVADVHVYTPERVEARYGIRPDQIPDFIGLKGDTSRQHPRHPGDRRQDRRAADRAVRLARGGDRARRRAVAGAREEHHRVRRPGAASPRSSRRCAATSTSTATRPQLVLAPPDRSQLKEIFRRFEFRNLLSRVDELDDALPAAPHARSTGRRGAVARGRRSPSRRPGRLAVDRRPAAVATGEGVVDRRRGPGARLEGELVVHDAKALGVDADGRHAARRLPDRPGPRLVRARRPRGRVRRRARAGAAGRGGDGCARPRAPSCRGGSPAPLLAPARGARR